MLSLKHVQQNQDNKELEMKGLFHYRIAVLVHHTKRLNEIISLNERSQKPALIQFTEEAKKACSTGKSVLSVLVWV